VTAVPARAPRQSERRRDGNAEARIQSAAVEWIRWCAPQCVVFHPANGGLRSKSEAARLKWIGVLPGIPDLVVLAPVGRVFFLEVKVPDRRLSVDQRDIFDRLVALGIDAAIVRSVDDVRMAFRVWGIKTREAA
jgi:VRR-NUC domain